MDVSKMMRWITQKMKTAGLWLQSLPITPHLSRCPYCGPKETTQASRCRQLYRIEFNLEGPRNTRLETYRKWTKEQIQQEHEKIVRWEDQLIQLKNGQPSQAASELYRQSRLCEVIVRNELPKLTAADWAAYALTGKKKDLE